mgnify:CR=1 FL=1
MNDKTLKIEQPNGNLVVELDRDQVIPEDPGCGDPARVQLGEYEATYEYALDVRELYQGNYGSGAEVRKLSASQVNWLDSIFSEVQEFLGPNW